MKWIVMMMSSLLCLQGCGDCLERSRPENEPLGCSNGGFIVHERGLVICRCSTPTPTVQLTVTK